MNSNRRDFLKQSGAASIAVATVGTRLIGEEPTKPAAKKIPNYGCLARPVARRI